MTTARETLSGEVRLTPETISAIVEQSARRTVELLIADARSDRVDDRHDRTSRSRSAEAVGRTGHDAPLASAAHVARSLGFSRQWVYEHAEQLGGRRIGSGPRGQWRFDLDEVRGAISRLISKQSQAQEPTANAESDASAARHSRRLPNELPKPGSVLGIRPR